jgi:hypothetical protein
VLRLEFRGEIHYWRGPSPYHFITVPADGCRALREVASASSYGWGVIPVTVRIGETEFATSLFPREGSYLVPVKDAVRRAEGLALGDAPLVDLTVEPRDGAAADGWS